MKEKEINKQKCPQCHEIKSDVYERPNNYAQDVGNEEGATWIACEECDYQNTMDI